MLPLEHSAILSTFIKLPFFIKVFVLSIFEWPFYTGFTVNLNLLQTENPLNRNLVNSEDPDEMSQNAMFHQGLHCLLKTKLIFSEYFVFV